MYASTAAKGWCYVLFFMLSEGLQLLLLMFLRGVAPSDVGPNHPPAGFRDGPLWQFGEAQSLPQRYRPGGLQMSG